MPAIGQDEIQHCTWSTTKWPNVPEVVKLYSGLALMQLPMIRDRKSKLKERFHISSPETSKEVLM